MKKSAILLAGGFSKRLGQEKAMIELAGKPLILHVLDRTIEIVDEMLVIVSSNHQKGVIERLLNQRANVVADQYEKQSPLIGALTGLEIVKNEYSLLFPCDTPFVSSRIASLLLDLCVNRSAVIPRWPDGYIEPLQAAYHTGSAVTAAKRALETGKMDLRSMIKYLHGVRYISTLVLQQIDPKLLTFLNINTVADLKKAESMFKRDV